MPKSIRLPVSEMPSLYMMSNSHSVKGGATLFLTTFILVRLPMTFPEASFICPILRMSMRTEAKNLSARPPGVVSGLPNITPIFSRIWFVNTQMQEVLLMAAVRRRMAWLIMRACSPTVASPICPSSSCRETRAATESITTTSIAPERMRVSAILRASSPHSGWATMRFSRSTPTTFA